MGDIVNFPGDTFGDLPVLDVLTAESAKQLSMVLIIGWDAKDEFYIASSTGKTSELIALLEIAKHELVSMLYD
jgi:hypothetical protein